MSNERQQVIDAANARMIGQKQAALDAYTAVCPPGHAHCGERCREAHQTMVRLFADANAAYSGSIPR